MENSQHGKQSMGQWVADYCAIARILRHRFQYSKTKKRDFRLLLQEIVSGRIASRRALYALTCRYCSPLMENDMFEGRWLRLKGLRSDCSTSQIIRQAQIQFAGTSHVWTAVIQYRMAPEVVLLHFIGFGITIGVQIHSADPSVPHNPFSPIKSTIPCDPADPLTVELIQNWLAECENEHIDCKAYSNESRSLPTRLVQILGQSSIRLVRPSQSVKYTALTYCWGKTAQPITTAENEQTRFHDFEFGGFPQTLKDAMHYSRALGIEFIWIDCLCIVQDNKDDWAAEAARLAHIYSGAFVVLAATRSHDVAEGFLRFRENPHNICFTRGRKPTCTVRTRRVSSHGFDGSEIDFTGQPLFERGWCMQERLLACRIVHFLPDEVFFECRQGMHCECGLMYPLVTRRVNRKTLWPKSKHSDSDIKDKRDNSFIIFDQWKTISRDFSRLKLTYPQDVLPALSGIAKRAVRLSPGKYLAGIWEVGIALHLGWYRSSTSQPASPIEQSEEALQPTFSWISSPDPISYQYVFKNAEAICTYMGGDSTRSTIDPFGKVSSSRLHLKGRSVRGLELLEGLNDRENHVYTENERLFKDYLTVHIDKGLMYTHNDPDAPAVVSYEGIAEALDWENVKCFGLFQMSTLGDIVRATLLLLYPAPDGSSYVRVGLVRQLVSTWFDKHATECEVTIV